MNCLSTDFSHQKGIKVSRRRHSLYATKVCRYNWHSAGSLGWPFPMIKYKYFFQIKYTEAISSDSIRKQLRFKISTRSSAIAEGPRDASCQLKSCQLPCNSAETTCTTSPEPSISCRQCCASYFKK